MQITCYTNFTKKPNSTKQPTGGTVVTCTLKDPTSIIKPVFKLAGNTLTYNYIKWGSRYYFVDDVVIDYNNYTEYHCSIDVMASWKTEIGSSSEYVIRAAADNNPLLTDMLYPVKVPLTHNTVELTSFHSTINSGGFYCVGIIGAGYDSNGITYYAMGSAGFESLLDYMFSTNWMDINNPDIGIETQKELTNPSRYIASCTWYPFALPTGLGTSEEVIFGYWASGIYATRLTGRQIIMSDDNINLPQHPMVSTKGAYVNAAPFTTHTLYLYNWGTFNIPSNDLVLSQRIELAAYIDIWSGSGTLLIRKYNSASDRPVLHQAVIQVGVSVPMASVTLGFMGNALVNSGRAWQWEGGNVGGALGSILGAIGAVGSAIGANNAKVDVIGQQANACAYNITPKIVTSFAHPVNDDNTQHGKPLCDTRQISTLSGFIKCEGAEVEIAGTQQERDAIIGFMNDGFYYE